MNKIKYWMLGLVLLALPLQVCAESVSADGALSSQEQEEDFQELTVGNTTHLNGDFFTDLWGNATSDLDVRKLLHGYNLVNWNFSEGKFQTNPTVISGFVATENSAGDHIYQIALYDDLFYSDGSPITARDYAFSILLQLSPEMEQLGARTGRMAYIKGADAYMQGSAQVLSGVRILNDHEFTVTIDAGYLPYFYELGLLNFQPWPIREIAPGVKVEDNGEGICLVNEDAGISEPVFTASLLEKTLMDPELGYRSNPRVTSGPYMLTDFDGETARFTVNPWFKGDADGALPGIGTLIYTFAENDTMIGKLKDGSFDLLNKVSSAQAIQEGIALVSSDSSFSMSGYPRSGMSFLSFAGESVFREDTALRQAFAWCLDREAIAAGYEGNFGMSVDGYYGIGQWMVGLLNGTVPYPVSEDDENGEELAAWEELSLDGLEGYTAEDAGESVSEARRLLDEAGWSLNEQGGAYDPQTDEVRCKEINGTLVPLRLTLAYPRGNAAGALLEEYLAEPLKEAGVSLSVEAEDFASILADYYGQESCGADLLYLATNFDEIFDPAENFRMDENGHAQWGSSGIIDDTLYDLAVDMRKTVPGDVLEYCRKWVAFQERFTAVLPAIPVYSNVYFDFYTSSLQNYDPMKQVSWAQEILYAVYGDAPESFEDSTEADDGQEVFIG